MSKMTQNSEIMRFMQENGSITQIQAADEFGCYRLSARIYDLRAAGYNIKTDIITKRGRYGGVINYAKYSLIDA